jgi:hypothetical protein
MKTEALDKLSFNKLLSLLRSLENKRFIALPNFCISAKVKLLRKPLISKSVASHSRNIIFL